MERMVLKVEGMDCAGCEQRLTIAVSRLAGVREAAADHTTGVLEVELDPGADHDHVTTRVTARVVEAGFTVADREAR